MLEVVYVECWVRVPPTEVSRSQGSHRQAESVKWRTAVGGGSPLGPEGAATPAPGGERAESGLLRLCGASWEPTRTQPGSDRALMLHYKSPRLSRATCRNFGMFWGSRVTRAAGR